MRVLDLFQADVRAKVISRIVGIHVSSVYRIVKRGEVKHKGGHTPHNKKVDDNFRALVKSKIEEDPTKSIRRHAKDFNVAPSTMHAVVKSLGKVSRIRPLRQFMSEKQKKSRQVRSKKILSWMKHHPTTIKIFSDEKIFTINQAYNRQNDRVLIDKGDTPPPVYQYNRPKAVTVLGVVASNGMKCPLIFVDQGVKLNAKHYIKLLKTHVVPWLKDNFPRNDYVFQQDGAPWHAAKTTQRFLKDNMRNFWSKEMWPPSSPDLNPLDYSIWGVMNSKACAKSHRNLADLRASILRAWDELSEDYVIKTCKRFRNRLEAAIREKRGLVRR